MNLQIHFNPRFLYELCVCVSARILSHVQLFATLWTVAHQAPLFMGFSRQKHWNGLPYPPTSLMSAALAGGFFTTSIIWEALCVCVCVCVCVCMCKYIKNLELPRWLSGKESACQCRRRRDSGSIPGQKNLLEKEIATHSNILAWEIPWMDESGRFQSTGYKDSDTT